MNAEGSGPRMAYCWTPVPLSWSAAHLKGSCFPSSILNMCCCAHRFSFYDLSLFFSLVFPVFFLSLWRITHIFVVFLVSFFSLPLIIIYLFLLLQILKKKIFNEIVSIGSSFVWKRMEKKKHTSDWLKEWDHVGHWSLVSISVQIYPFGKITYIGRCLLFKKK